MSTRAKSPPTPKGEREAKGLHWWQRFEHSTASAAAREAHLRALMGLPADRTSTDEQDGACE